MRGRSYREVTGVLFLNEGITGVSILFLNEVVITGVSDEDMTPMHMTMFGTWYGGVGGQQGCQVKKEA